jgi:hypothetical protein
VKFLAPDKNGDQLNNSPFGGQTALNFKLIRNDTAYCDFCPCCHISLQQLSVFIRSDFCFSQHTVNTQSSFYVYSLFRACEKETKNRILLHKAQLQFVKTQVSCSTCYTRSRWPKLVGQLEAKFLLSPTSVGRVWGPISRESGGRKGAVKSQGQRVRLGMRCGDWRWMSPQTDAWVWSRTGRCRAVRGLSWSPWWSVVMRQLGCQLLLLLHPETSPVRNITY